MHGPIEFDGANIEDFVILRSDGQPTYQLSVVSDDVEMEITHVVRGDDHISNTPKQILLYRALGAPVPQFAHVPLILGPDKKRLSKRHGATSVMEYARQGYLPEAMVNFLALLGWSPGDDRELFTRDELIAGVRARRHQRRQRRLQSREARLVQPAAHHAARAGRARACGVKPSFEAAGLWSDEYLGDRHAWFFAVLELLRPRAKRLGDFADAGRASSSPTRSSTTRPRSRSICARRDGRASRRARRGVRARCETFDPASTRGGAARAGRGARCEGGYAHSRRTCSGDGKNGKSRPVRGARTARPGARPTRGSSAARSLLLTSRS